MRDDRAFVAALDAGTRLRLVEKSDAAGLRHLTGHGAAILGMGLWIGLALPLWQIVVPLQGVILVFVFTLEREATHKTPFASEGLNEWVGRI